MHERGGCVDNSAVHRRAVHTVAVLVAVLRRHQRPLKLSWRMYETLHQSVRLCKGATGKEKLNCLAPIMSASLQFCSLITKSATQFSGKVRWSEKIENVQ